MNKFLLILLIAIVAASTIENYDPELEGWWSDLWDKIKNFVKSLPSKLKALYQWLKDNGYWEKLVELVKKYGIPKGIEFCKNYLDEGLCTDLVNFIFSFLK